MDNTKKKTRIVVNYNKRVSDIKANGKGKTITLTRYTSTTRKRKNFA